MSEKYRVIKCRDYNWENVERKQYKTDSATFRDIHRYSLLDDEQGELNAHTRYFEIKPGGYSSLEHHRHPHSVIVIRGSGTVILNNELQEIGLHDVVFIAPETLHQFHADQGEELGFICIVDRYRDKPTVPDEDTIRERITNPDVLEKIRR